MILGDRAFFRTMTTTSKRYKALVISAKIISSFLNADERSIQLCLGGGVESRDNKEGPEFGGQLS